MTRRTRRCARVDVQLPEAHPERFVLIDVELLVAEEQDLVGQERGFDIRERGIVQAAKLDAAYFGADYGGEGRNVHDRRL